MRLAARYYYAHLIMLSGSFFSCGGLLFLYICIAPIYACEVNHIWPYGAGGQVRLGDKYHYKSVRFLMARQRI